MTQVAMSASPGSAAPSVVTTIRSSDRFDYDRLALKIMDAFDVIARQPAQA